MPVAGIVSNPEVFGVGMLLGAMIGLVLERYVLEPLAALRVEAHARMRRRGR